MKTVFIFFLGLMSYTAFAGTDEAIAYNDKIVSEQNLIGKAILAFSASPTDITLQSIRDQAESSLKVLNNMKPYEGNSDLLKSAKELFKFYSDITKNEYQQVLTLLTNKGQYTQDDLTSKLNELINSISSKEKPLDEKFGAAQKEFAGKYGFKLTDNEIQDEIDGAGKKN